MKVSMIGLGKLGFPISVAIAGAGIEVRGYDPTWCGPEFFEHKERGLWEQWARAEPHFSTHNSVAQAVEGTDLTMVAVQTPHAPRYGGEQPICDLEPRDFDYTALQNAIAQVNDCAPEGHPTASISTVLPGTTTRITRAAGERLDVAYHPLFIAMGTTIPDFLNPEFVLIGHEPGSKTPDVISLLYKHVTPEAYVLSMRTINAELTKVLYNTFISQKVAFANATLELCHLVGGNCDTVFEALSRATDRVISPAYMRGGMGDGGACHPRDNIAMRWLASKVGLSWDPFEAAMKAREKQTDFLITEIIHQMDLTGADTVHILGTAYKPGTDLENGSPAILLANMLDETDVPYSLHREAPTTHLDDDWWNNALFFIALDEEWPRSLPFRTGQTVIDPFGKAPRRPGVNYVRLGRH